MKVIHLPLKNTLLGKGIFLGGGSFTLTKITLSKSISKHILITFVKGIFYLLHQTPKVPEVFFFNKLNF